MTNSDAYHLQCGHLSVSIMKPNSTLYRRTRFMVFAFISELSYDGVCLTRAEQDHITQNSTGGIGLCFEYQCTAPEAEAAPGEMYLKPGIGVLRRMDSPWHLTDSREVDALPYTADVTDTSVTLTHQSPSVNGYAYREMRTVSIDDCSLTVSVQLTNLGEKPLDLLEYCHNFLAPGDCAIDEQCELLLPCADALEKIAWPRPLAAIGNRVVWQGETEDSCFAGNIRLTSGQPAWVLSDKRSPFTLREETSFPPAFMNLWTTRYCVCPEVFHAISLPCGEQAAWSRRWRIEAR